MASQLAANDYMVKMQQQQAAVVQSNPQETLAFMFEIFFVLGMLLVVYIYSVFPAIQLYLEKIYLEIK